MNFLDNYFNSLLHFANVELASACRFIANFMFFREQELLNGDCFIEVTVEALETATYLHILQLEFFIMSLMIRDSRYNLHVGMCGEGRKPTNSPDKSHCMKLQILLFLNIAFPSGCHV